MATRAQAKQAKAPANGGFLSDIQDLWKLVVAYFKQETLEPIKGLQRFVGYGLLGSLAMGLGGIMLVLGLLRLLQTVDAFDGNWSFVPYLFTLVLAGVATVLAVNAGNRDPEEGEGVTASDNGRITRADIEAKLRQLRGEVEDTGEAVVEKGKALIGVAAAGVIGFVFLLGVRRGKKKSTVVEIRRV